MAAPKKNVAFTFAIGLVDRASRPDFKANPTLATGDFKVSIDGGAFANLTTLPTVTPASGRRVSIALSQAEMNGDNICVQCVDAAGSEWDDVIITIDTSVRNIDDVATQTSIDTIDDFLDTEIAAIKAKTDNLPAAPAAASDCITAAGVRTAVGLASANLDTQLDALPTAVENQSGMATASDLATVAGYLDTEIAAIKTVTDALPDAGALTTIQADLDDIQTRLPAALVGGRIDASLGAIGGDTAALTSFKRAVLGNVIGTCDAGSSTTSIVTSSLLPAASVIDQYKGRIVIFDKDTTTAALRGQGTDITGNTALGVLTVTALTTAPATGDTFTIT